jgi:hypothetical protein
MKVVTSHDWRGPLHMFAGATSRTNDWVPRSVRSVCLIQPFGQGPEAFS